MGNLKKPYFLGFLLVEICLISFSLAGMITMPYPLIKAISGIGGVVICYLVVTSFRRPVSDKFYVGLTMVFIGLVFVVGGIGLLNELLNPPHPVNHYEYTQWFEVFLVLAAIMVLCGVLSVLFSIIGLISNRMNGRVTDDSSFRLNS